MHGTSFEINASALEGKRFLLDGHKKYNGTKGREDCRDFVKVAQMQFIGTR